MRLDRLDLVRYGKFTDRSLDFGATRPGKPDFHLVHGPNEAGKSTLFSAYLDLLFGIEKSSTYGFLHPYSLMRVGGLLSIGASQQEAYRLKRNQASLVTADDRPLPDGLFASVLGGMDRHAYRTMFSLDDESIEKGGEDILKSEGELGAMLFSASSGLSDMASALTGLKVEADEFYRPSGRKHGLSNLKAEIEALAAERKALDVAARDYGLLLRERDAAAIRLDAATAARTRLRGALVEVERSLGALPALRRLRALRAELAAFDLGESPPPGWRSLLGELAREEAEIAARTEHLDRERHRNGDERDALPEDDAILHAEADILALSGSALEARFRTAGMDLAAREADRDRLEATMADALAALTLAPDTDPADLVLPVGLADRLMKRLSRRATLSERAGTAKREHADAQKALEALDGDAGAFEGEAGTDAALQTTLATALRAARANDLSGRLRAARRLAAVAGQEAENAMAHLLPWDGTPEALRRLAVPAAGDVDALRKRSEVAAEALRRQQEQIAGASLDVASARAKLDALLAVTGAVSDEQTERLRAARDAAWHAHRARLDASTADAFETAMRDDDRAAELRLRNADRLSEIRLHERAGAEASARLAVLMEEAGRLEQGQRDVEADIAALAGGLGLAESLSPAEVLAWLERRTAALEAADDLARCRVEANLVGAEAQALSERLAPMLGVDATEIPFDELLVLAEDRLEALRASHAARLAAADALERAQADVEARRLAAEEAAADLLAWQQDWNADVAGTWLASDAAGDDPERLAALLPALQALAQNIERKGELDYRIAAMRRDQQDYADRARGLAERLGEPFDANDCLSVVAALARRLADARSTRERREAIDQTLARLAEEAGALEERRAVLAARLSEIFTFLGCDTLAEAAGLLEAYRQRDDVLSHVADAARSLVEQMHTDTVDEAEALLAAVDGDQLQAEKADLAVQLDALDSEVQEHHLARVRAEEALAKVAGSDAAAALEERRRTALIELAEKSRRYLATRAGIMAAEQALRLYRERHRSAMMQRASDTFRDITGGEYAGLSTVLEKDGEFLVVNAAAGGSKLAKDLSKGTRFQLYLALRVAGYHEIAASREIVPFIADDIMETFDDRRALNTLRVMGDMAMGGQVIYLTHHQHLRDLAREACPDVTIHEL
ncbi:ATP-binding protein [Shinella sumterensis]|uniref:AAA family ATPase n=1 Tax=Shinella sumterensis TaxID=1967501 RepID=A0AA50CQX4_9HYPH|nr:AAA family ATPase [Shinella sumterensis]WLR99024.1 AAA family ATPase [Shinella sumterensis]